MNPQDPYQQPPQSPPPQAPMGQPPVSPQYPEPPRPQPAAYTPPQPAPIYAPQPAQVPPLSAQPTPTPPMNQTQYPVDYLNKIAAPAKQRTLNKFAVFGLIAGFLAVIIFAVFMMAGGGTPSISAQASAMRDRVRTLTAVTNEQQSHLTESDLSSMNATLNASLTSMNTELAALVGEKKTNKTNSSKPADKKEQAYLASLSKKLSDAYLRGTLDRTYSTEMAYQLAILKSQLQKMTNTAKTKPVKEFYAKNTPTLDAAIKKFSEFSAAK